MTINGDSLELDVPHSEPGTAYPIAVSTMATSFASVANPQLGYNVIVAGDDPTSNWSYAVDTGKAQRYRTNTGGNAVLSQADINRITAAETATLKVLFVTPRPGCTNPGSLSAPCNPAIPATAPDDPNGNSYYSQCHSWAQDYGGAGNAFEIMNETNHDNDGPGGFWDPPLSPSDYATYFRACFNAIRSVRPAATVLGGSVVRNWSDALQLDWGIYEYDFGPLVSDLDYTVSSHLYPQGSCLDSYSDMDICMNNWLGWDKALMSEPNGDARAAWVTEFGLKDNWKSCNSKGNWLQHGFLFLGNTFGVPKVLIYRFSRNRPSTADNWAQAGVYDATINSQDPDDSPLINGYYDGYQNCGIYALASVAG